MRAYSIPTRSIAVSSARNEIECPHCGEMVSDRAEKCRFCGEYLDEDPEDDYEDEDARPRRRRRSSGDQGVEFLAPVNVGILPFLAGYLGLFGCILGPLAPIALIIGIIAVRRVNAAGPKGATDKGRAYTGLVLGIIGTICWGGLLVFALVGAAMK